MGFISTPKFLWQTLPLPVVRHCFKLSSYEIYRKTNEPNLRKWLKKTNLVPDFGPFWPKFGPQKKIFLGFTS